MGQPRGQRSIDHRFLALCRCGGFCCGRLTPLQRGKVLREVRHFILDGRRRLKQDWASPSFMVTMPVVPVVAWQIKVHLNHSVLPGFVFAQAARMAGQPVGLDVQLCSECMRELLIEAASLLAQEVIGLKVVPQISVVPSSSIKWSES